MLRVMKQSITLLACICLIAGGIFAYEQEFFLSKNNTCEEAASRNDCFIAHAALLASSGDFKEALEYATEVVAPHSRNALHIAMHMIGHSAFEILGSRTQAMSILPKEAFTTEGHLIYDGFQHGVLQAYFTARKEDMSTEQLIEESCGEYNVPENDPRGPSPWRAALGCYHGVGHALMAASKNDMNGSIAVCAALPYYWMQQRCAYGVFMEVSYAYYPSYAAHSHGGKPLGDSMADACKEARALKEVCAQFVGHSYLMKHPGEYAQAFSTCRELIAAHGAECDIYLAEVILPGTLHTEDELLSACKEAVASEETCVLWVAKGLQEGYGGIDGVRMDFCGSLSQPLRERCQAFIQR